jgi:hypothetical protein
VRFARTNPSGCSAVVAHLPWEPFVPERCRIGALKRDLSERRRVDYCAFRDCIFQIDQRDNSIGSRVNLVMRLSAT